MNRYQGATRLFVSKKSTDECREHVKWLLGNGWTIAAIARTSGVDRNTIRQLLHVNYANKKRVDRMLRDNYERIMRIDHKPVDVNGKLRAAIIWLIENDVPRSSICERSGVCRQTLMKIINDKDVRLQHKTAQRLASACVELRREVA